MNLLSRCKHFYSSSPLPVFEIARIISIFCLSLLMFTNIFAQSPSPVPKVFTEYDRFRNETTTGVSIMLENYKVEIPFGHMQEFLMLLAGFTHSGKHMTEQPTTVRLAFQSQAINWRFGEGAQLDAIVDDALIAFGPMDYSRKNLGAGHIEFLRLDVPTRTFLKLARGKTIELRIGRKEMKLSEGHIAFLATLANQITGPSKR